MNHHTPYPSGSPRDVLIRLRRIESEVEQMLTDIQSTNDNNPNFQDEPIDVGRYLVRLKMIREIKAAICAVIDSGESKLPNGILDPLCEPW